MSDLDAYTVPEAVTTLSLQMDQLTAGLRVAMLFPVRPDGSHFVPLAPPVGIEVHETPVGVFYYEPDFVTPAELDRGVEGGYLNCFLNLGSYSKADIIQRIVDWNENPIAVVEASQDGTEVRCAWGTIETANEQMAYFQETKTPGHVCFVTSPLHVIAARVDVTNRENHAHDGGTASVPVR